MLACSEGKLILLPSGIWTSSPIQGSALAMAGTAGYFLTHAHNCLIVFATLFRKSPSACPVAALWYSPLCTPPIGNRTLAGV